MSTSEEREKTSRRLRELVETRTPAPADSSGYVDLSAYSASDPNWVEHALLRSKSGDATSPASRPVTTRDSREPGSVAPVAIAQRLESPLSPTRPPPRTRRRRTRAIASGMLASVGLLIAVYAFVVPARLSGGDARQPAATPPVVVGLPPAVPTPAPATPASTPMASASAAVPVVPSTPASASATAPRSKAPVTLAPARPRAPARPSPPSIPKGRSSSGDALTNAILQSFAEPAGKKK
jgi:hypothetical protein